MTDKKAPISEEEAKNIVRDHKVFRTTVPIEIPEGKGEIVRIGMSLVLVGTDAGEKSVGMRKDEPSVFDELYKIAEWLTAEDSPNVRFEIRRHENEVFYLPGDSQPDRKNYVVGIRILHSDKFDDPIDRYQLETLDAFQKRLKEIGCPKEHWKEKA